MSQKFWPVQVELPPGIKEAVVYIGIVWYPRVPTVPNT